MDLFQEGPEPERSQSHLLNMRLVCLLLIIIIACCFFYKACSNVNFKCAKLLHGESNNFNTNWM